MPENQVIKYTPNAYGDVIAQDNPGPNDIVRIYDERRRLTSETNGGGETTQYEYDGNNNRTAVIKPEGNRWEYDFDVANRLTHVRNVPEAIETIYTYDAADNLKTITDAENKVTTFDYDDRNRKTSKTYPDDKVMSYSYDANGNVKTIDYPNGANIAFDYDDLNRESKQTYSGSLGSASIDFTLDGNGNVEQKSLNLNGSTFTTTMDYDDLDRMTSKTDWFNNTSFYTYDPNGNRKIFKDYDNQLMTYEYDDLNRLSQIVKAGLGAVSYSYNAAGLRSQIDYANGTEVSYSYDNADRTELIDNKQSGVTVTSHEYEYDLNGNRTKLTESNIQATQITSYTYDDADRLIQTNYPSYISTLTLDKVGNRTEEIIADPGNGTNTITYTYNNRDQLTTTTDTNGNNTTYQYDAAGNQTEINNNGIITTLTYSPRQRVASITQGANPTINYLYDADGLRVQKEADGQTTRYIYDDEAMIAETNTLGNTIARYYYSDTAIFAETRNGQNAYHLQDALGTTVAMTNQDGSVQVRYNYDVWGNRNNQTGTSDQPFGFTGYQLDETGLYYAQQRYYNPTTARFNREDPLQGNPQTPPSLHRYLYAYANPTVYIDPDGRQSDSVYKKRTQSVEDVMREARVRKSKADLKMELKHYDDQLKLLKDEQMMRVAETSNNETLLKRNISLDETISRAHMSACVYESPEICNSVLSSQYRRITDQELRILEFDSSKLYDEETGFQSDIFVDRDGNMTLAFAGTNDINDVFIDISQTFFFADQYTKAIEIATELAKRTDELNIKLAFTGHSMGGGMAEAAALATGKQATSFNAAGLGFINRMTLMMFYQETYKNREVYIESLYVKGEIVSIFQDSTPFGSAVGRRTGLEKGNDGGAVKLHFMASMCQSIGEDCDYSKPN